MCMNLLSLLLNIMMTIHPRVCQGKQIFVSECHSSLADRQTELVWLICNFMSLSDTETDIFTLEQVSNNMPN